MHWLLFYDVVSDFVVRRESCRLEHLAYAESAHRRGFLVLAGALDEPMDGAVLVFRADDREVAEQFARDDPYVRDGLVTRWQVRRWNVVVGGPGDHGIGQTRSGIW